MQTVYRLNSSELDNRFLEALKTLFQDKEIEIVVTEIDETVALPRNPQPIFGSAQGLVAIGDDFDDPIEGFGNKRPI